MCGIVGIVYNNSSSPNHKLLESMNEKIRHRGPDEDGFYFKENVGLAMRRLAIIDLKCGKQPIANRDQTKWVVFNGEIYNFQELRQDLEADGYEFKTNSDTEAIVHLYDKYGVECVKHLRGMFAFAIWDETEKSLFIARDRLGKKPLLYSHQSNGDLIFGSEFAALLVHPSVSREVDYAAIDSYLTLQSVPAPLTAYKQIRKLKPAHWLLWKNGEVKTERYWQPDFSKKLKISEPEAIEETTRVLREAVKLRMISEVPLGAFLSGGVDSSAVVALMAEQSSQPVKTFSIGFEEQDFSETKYARAVANHIGAEHHEFIVKPDALEVLPTLVEHYGEPYADPSALPTYYVARETRRYVTVALNGDGGDESFAGYERYAAMHLAEKYQKIPNLLRENLVDKAINLFPSSELRKSRIRDLKRFLQAAALPQNERYLTWISALKPEMKSRLYSSKFRTLSANGNGSSDLPAKLLNSYFEAGQNYGLVDRLLFVDQQTYLPNDLLVKVDIATMANSLEARSPFLDHKVIEFAASLPENFKLRSGTQPKYLLKKIAAQLVPSEVIYRRKMGFSVPFGTWFRHQLKNFVAEVLLSEKAKRRKLFDHEFVKQMIETHTTGKKDYSNQIWTLLMLELWFRQFID